MADAGLASPAAKSQLAGPAAQTELGPSELSKHFEGTYFTLRGGLAAIAIAFPILLYVIGRINGVPLQNSMSAYYLVDGLVRDVFVGVLVAVGACLYLYKGFSSAENIALNLAGIFAVGIALFPTQGACTSSCPLVTVHGASAILFFACIAYVCVFRASDTLTLLDDDKKIATYKRSYQTLGTFMIVSPVAAFVLTTLIGWSSRLIFFVEAFGVWTFAAYWIGKSRELHETSAERRALEGRIARKKVARRGPDDVGMVPSG